MALHESEAGQARREESYEFEGYDDGVRSSREGGSRDRKMQSEPGAVQIPVPNHHAARIPGHQWVDRQGTATLPEGGSVCLGHAVGGGSGREGTCRSERPVAGEEGLFVGT